MKKRNHQLLLFSERVTDNLSDKVWEQLTTLTRDSLWEPCQEEPQEPLQSDQEETIPQCQWEITKQEEQDRFPLTAIETKIENLIHQY